MFRTTILALATVGLSTTALATDSEFESLYLGAGSGGVEISQSLEIFGRDLMLSEFVVACEVLLEQRSDRVSAKDCMFALSDFNEIALLQKGVEEAKKEEEGRGVIRNEP